jgi:hypothetical protein
MTRLPALAAALCACAAFAADADKREGPIAVEASLAPKALHEECMRLEPGDKRGYHWKASAPVDFNVHYHRGDEVFYPVKSEGMRADGGTFVAKIAEDYCWMWSARDKPAKVEGRIK